MDAPQAIELSGDKALRGRGAKGVGDHDDDRIHHLERVASLLLDGVAAVVVEAVDETPTPWFVIMPNHVWLWLWEIFVCAATRMKAVQERERSDDGN